MMPQRYEYDLICIGSGPAGQRAAVQAAKLGKKAAVMEKQPYIGGVCVDSGTIPSKTFREAVRRLCAAGIAPGDPFASPSRTRPTMSHLIGHVGRVMQHEISMILRKISELPLKKFDRFLSEKDCYSPPGQNVGGHVPYEVIKSNTAPATLRSCVAPASGSR